ncbi:MAG: GcrA family cell cycle regulator [Xanthobacteraceae bacterium]|nr:GcrA family cell cycle regulator [Xanthobacteraceae bacterium]
MSWDAKEIAALEKLWTNGQSAGEIARSLGQSRNAVCAKLKRMGLKRGHKPPTASPRIVSAPKSKPAQSAACTRPMDRVVSRKKPVVRQQNELTKNQLYAMLAQAVRNTG